MELQNRSGMSREAFVAARDQLLAAGQQRPAARLGPTQRPARRRHPEDRHRPAEIDRARAQPGRRQLDPVDRVGRALRQRLHRPGPGQAGLCPGRRALPLRPREPVAMVCPLVDGEMAPFSSFARIGWATGPSSLSRFQGVPAFEFQGQPAPGVSSGQAMNRIEQLAAEIPGTSIAWAGQSYPGTAVVRPGAVALRHFAAGRVPVPGGALRKLVDPGRGAADHPAGPGRRDLRRDPARARERRLPADRAADDHGPGRQERDPDERVRRAVGKAGACG